MGFFGNLLESFGLKTPKFGINAYLPNRKALIAAANTIHPWARLWGDEEDTYLEALQRQYQGSGPSIAERQLQQSTDDNIRRQMAMAAGMGGYSGSPAAMRNLAFQSGAMNQQSAADAALLRAREQQAAYQTYAAALDAARQHEFQRGAYLQNSQQNVIDLDIAESGRQMAARQARMGAFNQTMSRAAQAAGMAAMSDKRAKENIEPIKKKKELYEFLDSLNAYKFNYKDREKDGEGDYYGAMAQDLEKSKVGRSMVVDTPRGKMVENKKLLMALLGSGIDIHKRLKSLEKRRGL